MVFVVPGVAVVVLVLLAALIAGAFGGDGGSTTSAFDGNGSQLLGRGRELVAQAQSMPAGPARNEVYDQAAAVLQRATQKLEAEGQTELMRQANMARYSAVKMKTE